MKLTQLQHAPPKPPKGCDDVRVPRSEILTVIEHPCDFDPPFKPEFCPPDVLSAGASRSAAAVQLAR